jgi:hypothetical protein
MLHPIVVVLESSFGLYSLVHQLGTGAIDYAGLAAGSVAIIWGTWGFADRILLVNNSFHLQQ